MQDFKFVKKLGESQSKRQIVSFVTITHDIYRRSFLIAELKPFICYQNDRLMIITQNPCFDLREIKELRKGILATIPITQFSVTNAFSTLSTTNVVSTTNTIKVMSYRSFYSFENGVLSFYLELQNE